MVALITLTSIGVYAFFAALFGRLFYLKHAKREWDGEDAVMGTFFMSWVWPISLLAVLACVLASRLAQERPKRQPRPTRKDKDHQRSLELLEAQRKTHEAALAVLRANGVNV